MPLPRSRTACLGVVLCLVSIARGGVAHDDAGVRVPRLPQLHKRHVLVESAARSDWRYLAFPALLDLGHEVLISYKRGRSHAQDVGATLELIRVNSATQGVSEPETLARLDGHILQMGQWVRFPNGEIASYIDTQLGGPSTTRAGLRVVRSQDGGRTFSPIERVGVIDGVEYGYAFDSVVEGGTTWMLVMTFTHLQGGRPVFPPRPHAGSVDVIRSEDHGRSWHFVRNLSHEFGDVPINESTLIRHREGFLISTRGYDDRQRFHLTDGSFRVLRQVDLTGEHEFIASHVGRPRLFARDGRVYLLGRNWTHSPRVMQLCLFRLDPDSLHVSSYAVLDNVEKNSVADGYYAMPYFSREAGDTVLNVVTYHRFKDAAGPDIVRYEYLWREVN